MANKLFTTIPKPKVPRNTFNLGNQVSITGGFNKLYPLRLMEIIPGDLFSVSSEVFSRVQPMIAPVLNDMKVKLNAFYVPLRTLNNHFNEFMWNNKNGDYSDVLPYTDMNELIIVLGTVYGFSDFESEAAWALFHELTFSQQLELCKAGYSFIEFLRYMSIPYDYSPLSIHPDSPTSYYSVISEFVDLNQDFGATNPGLRINIAPFLAYEKVWNEYYRDENLVEDIFDKFSSESTIDIFDLVGQTQFNDYDWADCCALIRLFQLRPKAWGHDRFTSALPFAQRGPDVALPVEFSGEYPVKYKKQAYGLTPQAEHQAGRFVPWGKTPTDEFGVDVKHIVEGESADAYGVFASPHSKGAAWDQGERQNVNYDPGDSLYTQVDDIQVSSTIRDFRRALRLQQWYENSARGGYRPNEAALSHFGVHVPDQSLQRAQFLGGLSSPLVVSEVPQTSATEQGTSPQGTLAGKASQYISGHLFKQFFTEHGFVVIMYSSTVRANYFQGLDRMYSRMTRDEYAWPEFANLGEEPVYTKELYAMSDEVEEDTVFGYLPRYSDYKCAINQLKGDFTTSLKFWVQPREFADMPKLNEQFIYDSAPLTPFAVQDGSDVILSIVNIGVKASRLLPFYGVPTI